MINAKLAGMTAEEQVAGFKRMMREATPKGTLGLNPLVPHISANRQNDNRWIVTVAPTAFSSRKAELAQLAPGMVSSGDNFYPGEALLVSYSVASGDMGFGLDHQATVKRLLSNLTGLDMNNRQLYGENGYFVRRPLNTFLTESAMNQYFLELGF